MAPRARKPESRAYILMQALDNPERWFIVNRSGPVRNVLPPKKGEAAAPPVVRYDEESDDTAFDAMNDDVPRRLKAAPGRVIVAVLAAELPTFGLAVPTR